MGNSRRPRIVILGAGFAGVAAARTLTATSFLAPRFAHAQVLLLDRSNYHTFSPLVYRVGTSEFEPGDVAFPVRRLFRNASNVEFRVGRVEHVDLDAREVELSDATVPYDYLVLALGSTPHLAVVPGAADSAWPLKTLEQGIALRNHILLCLERAVYATDPFMVRYLLTFAIVGGGLSGIEFAGALADFARTTLPREYPDLAAQFRIVLIECGARLASELPQAASTYVQATLTERGVQVLLNSRVHEVTPQGIYLERDLLIPAATVVWGAGVRGVPDAAQWGLAMGTGNRIAVRPTLQIPGHPEVFAAGDLALVPECAFPQTALAAVRQGQTAARNILRQIEGAPPLLASRAPPQVFATIGRRSAVAWSADRSFAGLVGWVLWANEIRRLVRETRAGALRHWARLHLAAGRGTRLILPFESEPGIEQLAIFDSPHTR